MAVISTFLSVELCSDMFVSCSGLTSNYSKSTGLGGGTSQVKVILYLSDVPTTEPEQLEFFEKLKNAIRSILIIPLEWNINVTVIEDYSSIKRSLGSSRNVAVSIVITALSSEFGDIAALQTKLNDQTFTYQLNSLGFKASTTSLPSTSTSNQLPWSLIVGMCSAAGILILILVSCLAKRFYDSARDKSKIDISSGTLLDYNIVNCSLNVSADELHKEDAHEKIESGECLVDSSCILSSNPLQVSNYQINEADYSKEFEDILQLMARCEISLKSFVDPGLRKEIQEIVQHSNEISAHDCSAILQLISRFELNESLLEHSPDQMKLHQQRIEKGPMTEFHFLVLKLMCKSEVKDTSMAMKEDTKLDDSEVQVTLTRQRTLRSKDEIVENSVTEDKPLLDVLQLLKKCDLEPSYLMQKESRKLIEENLTNREGPLLPEHLAVLQLLSKAEIDSDLSLDSMRKHLLEERIKEGPLNTNHLCSVQTLCQLEKGEPDSMRHTESGAQAELSQLHASSSDHKAKQNDVDICEITSQAVVSNQVVSLRNCPAAEETKVPFFLDTICGLEVRPSLLSREEKSALQLMELRAKTARIRQSLPEWVKKGLVPPRHTTPPLAGALLKKIASVHDHHTSKDAVQISCGVQADLGFLNDFFPPAKPQMQQDELESLFLGHTAAKPQMQQDALESLFLGHSVEEEQCVDIETEEPKPATDNVSIAANEYRLSPTPQKQSSFGLSLAYLFSSLSQCLSYCLQAVVGACCSGLSCLSGHREPGHGN